MTLPEEPRLVSLTDGWHAGDPIRAKWMFDGCVTLAEAAERARSVALTLDALHAAGWTLDSPVDDDYGFLVSPDGDRGPSNSPED